MGLTDSIFLTNLLSIFDIEALIRYGGLAAMFLVVYASVGLFFCFFLPSGAVLFTGGVFVATETVEYDLVPVCVLLTLASIVGNLTGYWFGRQAGPALYRRKDSRFYRRQYLEAAEAFYKKHGGLAIVAAFFLPVIRTFAPVVAGMVRHDFKRFMISTITGSFFYVTSFVCAGYFIGSRPFLKPWLRYIVIGIIILVTIPVLIKIVRGFKKWRKENRDEKSKK